MDDMMKTLKPGMMMIIVGLILQAIVMFMGSGRGMEAVATAMTGDVTVKMFIAGILSTLGTVAIAVGIGQCLIGYWHSSKSGG